MYLIPIVLAMGMLVPVQTAANARMRGCVSSAWVATLISFCVSALSLLAVCCVGGVALAPTAAQVQTVPWWGWLGGIIALFTITASIYLFRTLGLLQATVLPIVGQLVFSLVIDHFGLFRSVQIPLSAMRVLALACLMLGMALAVVLPKVREWRGGVGGDALCTSLRQILGIVAGGLMASIGAIYGTLGRLLGSPVQASVVSFIIAAVAMLVCCALGGQIGRVRYAFCGRSPWWMWLGGIVGAISVFGNAWLIPQMGAGVFFMILLIGQMLLSVCMEWWGWLGTPKRRISPLQCVGLLLMLVSIALIRL